MQNIVIKTDINAPVKKVWEYYTSPNHITNWNFASNDWCCPSAENDLTPNGKYKARMEAKDGSFGFDFEAIYNEIILNKKIDYTMMDNRKVIINFNEIDDNKTAVTIVFEAENQNPIDMQEQGWMAILNNFKSYTENN